MSTEKTGDALAASKQLPEVDLSWLSTPTGLTKKRKEHTHTALPKRRGQPGRPSVRERFPEVLPAATRFINDNGFRAHRRRRETGTCGSTLRNIKQHLKENIPGLQDSHPNLSDRTVARWMMPPNRAFHASKSYAGLIDARVPAKDNSGRKDNDNSHFYSARVRYVMECASKHNQEVLIYSADNKNKIKVGDSTLAVDRRIAIRRIFPCEDTPIYQDHDFPTPGYLLVPSGYLELDPSTLQTTDNYGRDHYVFPQPGSSSVFIRSPHSPCNVATHLHDMTSILDKKEAPRKSVLFLVVDGGPDFNVNHWINLFYYGRFFRDTNLDALLVTSYCPGDSALNPIEHLWAPCTHALTSVYLPSTLDGEVNPPCAQSGLSAEERLRKEHQVFNKAAASIRDIHWRHLQFNGQRVNVCCVPSGVTSGSEEYDRIKQALGGSGKTLKDSDYYNDFKFCMSHIDRRIGTVIFSKCQQDECTHCMRNPPRASPGLMDCLRSFPTPQPSTTAPGHFLTFKESLLAPRAEPCEHLPQYRSKGLGRCCIPGCKYVFSSQKDVIDHRRKFHR
ncbi:uncharacterized protein LOC121416841 [Lytechinus variegatus]|uniref:uncharacterized protein LOC121416841 n=1 Tax=Lytechinus variegatus TaxID=7654 RepID=UPI001BB0DF4B|nr:uncharacterized protein LOC121416841 [Lytechinus variegatus]